MKKIIVGAVVLCLVSVLLIVLIKFRTASIPETARIIKPMPLPAKTFHASPESYNRFAVESYRKIIRGKSDQNAVFSPLNLSMALEVLYAGSAGETARSLENMLHLTPQSDHAMPQNPALFQYKAPKKAMIDPMSFVEHPPIFLLGNAIWYADDFVLDRRFGKTMKKDFSLETFPVNFAKDSGQITQDMDRWVNRVTQGLIPSLNVTAEPESTLTLQSTLYFKAFWDHRFETRNTSKQPFTLVDGKKIKAERMGDEATYPFMQNEEFKALEMPYTLGWDGKDRLESDFSMLFILPHEIDGIYALEEKLSEALLRDIVQSLAETYLWVSVPKFRLEQENNLLAILGDSMDSPNFSNMFESTPDNNLVSARQKIVLGIDEHGTEAAVFLEMAYASLGSEPPVLIVDHPFLFLIRERKTGTILFLGRVMNPKEK